MPAIRVEQFLRSLNATCREAGVKRSRFAIAVSGGVDSMALAHLCAKAQQGSEGKLHFRALVVDHQARKGSRDEARETARRVREMGLPAQTLRIQWPDGFIPLELFNFETTSRKLRYQVLGRACQYLKLNSVLVAHHGEDEVEQILMRIAMQYTGAGLGGIASAAQIPECEHMLFSDRSVLVTAVKGRLIKSPGDHAANDSCRTAVDGSLIVHRPLLKYDKKDLRMTCIEAGVEWTEDETNADRTLTIRNSVRQLLSEGRLPKALGPAHLLNLKEITKQKIYSANAEAAIVARYIRIVVFDVKTGTLRIRVLPEAQEACQGISRYGLALVLTELASIISPTPVLKGQIGPAVDMIFGHIEVKAVTSSGIFWQPKRSSVSGQIWSLSRQPLGRNDEQPYCAWDEDTRWQLFDGRFWLRVIADSPVVATIQTEISLDDPWFSVRADSVRKASKDQMELLRRIARGRLRGQVPTLSPGRKEAAFAFPTVGLIRGDMLGKVSWEVQYKSIDLQLFGK